jgi:predicted nucleotidyltransferase
MTLISHLQQRLETNRHEDEIQAFCGELVDRYRPLKITLFGSHALGMAREDSDVDILVEMEQVDSALGMAATIVRETKPGFAVDILVRTPRQVKERVQMGDPFMIAIVNSGKVIYEHADR